MLVETQAEQTCPSDMGGKFPMTVECDSGPGICGSIKF